MPVKNNTTPDIQIIPPKNTELAGILKDMSDANIDPDPYYRLAACQLTSLFGDNAIYYAHKIYMEMNEAADIENAYLWKQIHDTLFRETIDQNPAIH